MKAREHFDECLRELSLKVLKLGTYVEGALKKALNALMEQDVKAADEIMVEDDVINQMQLEIEDECVGLIAREQPVAGDLREIMTTIKVVSNLERIGDHAVHLAKATKRLAGQPYHSSIRKIKKMAEIGIQMVHDGVDAYVNKDNERARAVAKQDDEIDEIHDALVTELLDAMRESEQSVEMSTSFLFVSRFMERLGDHMASICEWVVYGIEGEHVELNQ
jgi:phosphate transport system protein